MQHQRFEKLRQDAVAMIPKGFVSPEHELLKPKTTLLQPVGTQARLIDAAVIASYNGQPINTLLTIRTMALEGMEPRNRFNRRTLAQDVRDFCELLRKWLIARQGTHAFIWAREWSRTHGEHLHVGLHLGEGHTPALAAQCAKWFNDLPKPQAPAKAVIAESVSGIWNLKRCIKNGTTGTWIASYLGKDEPEFRVTSWGKTKRNTEKRDCRHSPKKGPIVGLPRHSYRHGVSKNISPASPAGKAILTKVPNEERLIGICDQIPY